MFLITAAKLMRKPPQQHYCEAQMKFLKSSISLISIYTNTAVGDMPYCFLKAVEKCEGFLNPTSA